MLAIKLHIWKFDEYAILSEDCKYRIGDLISYSDSYFLILWQQDNFHKTIHIEATYTSLVYRSLISIKTVKCINRMVLYWYSTYYNILPLFVCMDRNLMTKYHRKSKKKPSYQLLEYHNDWLEQHTWTTMGQQLVIFPDLWTMTNMISTYQQWWGVKVLYSQMTNKQKIETFWWIKYGTIHTLICTHSQLFQDRKQLSHILIIDPHKWYYKNQRDPRYHTMQVATYMANLYSCPLSVWSALSL